MTSNEHRASQGRCFEWLHPERDRLEEGRAAAAGLQRSCDAAGWPERKVSGSILLGRLWLKAEFIAQGELRRFSFVVEEGLPSVACLRKALDATLT